MPKSGFDMVKVGAWKRFRIMLDPDRFNKALNANIKKATQFNAMLVVKEIRKRIQGKGYSGNAALTMLIKNSSKPIIGVGDNELFKAITFEMISNYSAFVGVLRGTEGKDGSDLANVAAIVHEGATIGVTDAMRGLFLVLSSATDPDRESKPVLEGRAKEIFEQVKGRGKIHPLKPSTTAIVVPPRPFIKDVFDDPKIREQIQANWRKAVQAALNVAGGVEPSIASAAPQPEKKPPAAPKVKSAKHIAAGKLGWARRKAKMKK